MKANISLQLTICPIVTLCDLAASHKLPPSQIAAELGRYTFFPSSHRSVIETLGCVFWH